MPNKSNHRKNIVFFIIIAGLVALFSLPAFKRAATRVAGDFYHPFFKAPLSLESEISDKSLLLESKATLASKLVKLQEENEILSAKLAVSKDLAKENAELRIMSRMRKRPGFSLVRAEVVRRDPMNWNNVFHIDKGTDDGVTVGAAVLGRVESGVAIDEPAVIGRVVAAGGKGAEVRTLVDPRCEISVVLTNSGATGVLRGGTPAGDRFQARLSYVPKDVDWVPGENVRTSGFSETIPGGLYVGALTRGGFGHVHNPLFQTLGVLIAGRFRNVRTVLVATLADEVDDE